MKNISQAIFITFFLKVLPIVAKAEVFVNCVIFCSEECKIKLYTPVNENYNLLFLDRNTDKKITQHRKNSVSYSFNLNKPYFIDLFLFTLKDEFITKLQLLVFPNDSLKIEFQITNKVKISHKIAGNNGAGHHKLAEINSNPSLKFQLLDSIINAFPKNKKNIIEEIKNKCDKYLNEIILFQKQRKVSTEYLRILRKSVLMNYYDYVIRKMFTPSIKSNKIEKPQKNELAEIFYAELPITDKEIKQLSNSYLYYMDYLRFLTCKKFDYNSFEDVVKAKNDTIIGGINISVPKDYSFVLYCDKKELVENIWALSIGVRLRFAPGEYDLDVISQFNLVFPNSKWASILNEQFYQYSGIQKISYSLQMPINIIDTAGNIPTIDSAITKINGSRFIFVDCWASWCSPCVGAFSYNKIIDSFFIQNNIDRLYVSIDNIIAEKIWRHSIYQYKLGGNHVLAGSDMIENILIRLNKTSPFYIPQYFIYDKYKKLIYQNLPSPSNTNSLIQNIKEIISLN